MAKHIVIANQKGGVGKTTTAVNLTASLHAAGKSVLLCDFDPQANATSGLGVDKNAVSPNIYDILIDGADVERGVVQTPWGDVLPSNKELAGAGVEMIGMDRREHLLREALDKLSDRYDYILIDCPPSLELLTLNGLCAADSVLIPELSPVSVPLAYPKQEHFLTVLLYMDALLSYQDLFPEEPLRGFQDT